MCVGDLKADLTKLSCCPEYRTSFPCYQLWAVFFYLCLKGSCISFRLLNTRGLVLKRRTTVAEYRAWSPGEFRTLKTCLVFVLKGLDSILLNKSYNCSFCFLLFLLLQELDMNEGDLGVCLVSLLKQSHEETCSPFLKQSWISSSKEPFSTDEYSISSTPGPRCYYGEAEQTLFCTQEAQLLFFVKLISIYLGNLSSLLSTRTQTHLES